MNADIISMFVKLPSFKHFEQFLWHSCISIICQKIPGRSLSVMFNYYSSERIHACSYRLNSCQKQLIKQTWYFSGIIAVLLFVPHQWSYSIKWHSKFFECFVFIMLFQAPFTVLSTLPDYPGDSIFWTVSPGLQIMKSPNYFVLFKLF